jgi:hypothetical protein
MTGDSQMMQDFSQEPSVTPLPFIERPIGRILLTALSIALLGILLGVLSGWMIRLKTPRPPESTIVVASHDLRPYQLLGGEDLELGHVPSAVAGTVLTDTVPLLEQAIVLQAIDEGQAVTAESVITFPATIGLTDTLILAIPLPPEKVTLPALEPGSSVWIIGSTISDTVTTPIYSTTVPLVGVTGVEAVVAVRPEVAAHISLYLPPWGRVILAPTILYGPHQ